MGKGASNFRGADVKRAIRAAIAGGLKVERVEVEGRKFTLHTSDGEAHTVSTVNQVKQLAKRKSDEKE